MTTFPIANLVLQGDINADGYTILNLNLSGLNLTKASVGLGNVDNTADLDKPLSGAMLIALGDKENFIPPGNVNEFWIGTKGWKTFGALALESGTTGLPVLSSIASGPNGSAILRANSSTTASSISIRHLGPSVIGSAFPGVPLANAGMLAFDGCSTGIIRTNNGAPIMFGVSNTMRMRLRQGLDMGGDDLTDPGAGCIDAYGTITAGEFVGPGSGITGIVKGQIPAILNATTAPVFTINGEDGDGYVEFGAQTVTPAPSSALALIFANTAGQLSFLNSASEFAISINNSLLTADRIYNFLNVAGSLPVLTAIPASAGAAGVAGQMAYESGKLYVCIAANTWQRVTIATW